MPDSFNIGDLISGLALLLSVYATITTHNFNKRQKSLIEGQKKLNKLLLEKEEIERINDVKADLNASFIKLGNQKFRLKIWNKGKGQARNVSIDFPDGNTIIPQTEIDGKFPLETLDEHQCVELIASVAFGKKKHTFKLIWSDGFSEHNEKLVHPTI